MPKDRGVGQVLPELMESDARARYEAHQALEVNDYLFGGTLSSGLYIEDLPAGNTTEILFQNDAGSEAYYDVAPTYITNGRANAQKHINVGVNALGSELPVAQQRSDFINNNSNTTVTIGSDVDKTNARVFPKRLLSVARDEGIMVRAESVLIAPGDNLDITIENTGAQPCDVTIYLKISPMPANLIDTITDGPSE